MEEEGGWNTQGRQKARKEDRASSLCLSFVLFCFVFAAFIFFLTSLAITGCAAG